MMEMRDKRRFVVTVIAVMLIGSVCFGTDDGDFQYWTSAKASFDMYKDWTISVHEEFRLQEGACDLYYQHTEASFVYGGLADWLDLGLSYRQISIKDSGGTWRDEHRPHLNITLKGKLFGLSLSDRSRFEYRDREVSSDLWRYRNKFTVKLPLELTGLKLQPYFADEVFINLTEEGYNRNRFYSGVAFNLAKNVKGEIFYLWQTTRSGGFYKDIGVIGTNLKITF